MANIVGDSRLAVVIVGLAALAGCSRGSPFPEATILGIVKVGSAPVDHGAITFSPLDGGQGAVAGAIIEDGQFHCEHAPVGKVTVTFNLQAKEPRRFTDATGAVREVPVSLLAEKYRAGVPRETQAGDNRLDFSLDPPETQISQILKK
jgi:hypothetical protein